jgi:RIO kinase 1
MIYDEEGYPAPRLNDIDMDEATAIHYHAKLIKDVVIMLCAGVVHGDLSEFNILVDANGPRVIDFPQAVDPTSNNNAYEMLCRDVKNLADYFGMYAPELKTTTYAQEMWDLYKKGELTPHTHLTGNFQEDETNANVSEILDEIEFARKEAIRAEMLRKRLENEF